MKESRFNTDNVTMCTSETEIQICHKLSGKCCFLATTPSPVTSLSGGFEKTGNLTCSFWTNESTTVTHRKSQPLFIVANSNKKLVCVSENSVLNMNSHPKTNVSVTVQIWLVCRQTSGRLSHTISVTSDSPCAHRKTQQQNTHSHLSTHRAVLQQQHKFSKQSNSPGCGCKTQTDQGQVCVDKRPWGELYQHTVTLLPKGYSTHTHTHT